ncbi:hypothetical protein KM176_11455 [Pseudooceanicola sp. CBS1P-1]|uniref:Uncharacterized protein n=1 Tax=Pseudooceanicola albus TaxID=2692189 RepID=A0A6L7GAB3_9RHOB|nr:MULTISPECIES: hypothetical protein [Pseudooceanicola]MBT9384477.1 hypothetical protein [Pseudooceanicola endophyticus]MXN20622.1 hypothetical protein [Pseudooceanicola albus]
MNMGSGIGVGMRGGLRAGLLWGSLLGLALLAYGGAQLPPPGQQQRAIAAGLAAELARHALSRAEAPVAPVPPVDSPATGPVAGQIATGAEPEPEPEVSAPDDGKVVLAPGKPPAGLPAAREVAPGVPAPQEIETDAPEAPLPDPVTAPAETGAPALPGRAGAPGRPLDPETVPRQVPGLKITGSAPAQKAAGPAVTSELGAELAAGPPGGSGADSRALLPETERAQPEDRPALPVPEEAPEAPPAHGTAQHGTAARPETPMIALSAPAAPAVSDALPGIGGRAMAAEPALKANAAPPVAADGRPQLALVLVPETEAVLSGLRAFDGPLALVLDPAQPGVTAAMRRLRAAGREVVIGPVSGRPAGWIAALPAAVAVLETAPDPLDSAALDALAASGHGLLLGPGATGTDSAAGAQGLVLGQVSAVTDPERAAEAARSTGGAIAVMPLTPETLARLLAWRLGPEARAVQLVPLSQRLDP